MTMSNFVTKARADGSRFVDVTDDHRNRGEASPVYRGVLAAHDVFDSLPNDWIFEVCSLMDYALQDIDVTDWDAVHDTVQETADTIAENLAMFPARYHQWASDNYSMVEWGKELYDMEYGEVPADTAQSVWVVAKTIGNQYAYQIVRDAELVATIGSRFVDAG